MLEYSKITIELKLKNIENNRDILELQTLLKLYKTSEESWKLL